MKFRALALAALAAASFSAQATLTTYAPWETAYSGNGLSGVLFNVQTDAASGATVAMGAHAYKNSAFLANDGIGTFYAAGGLYAPDGKNYANWSFDFGWDFGTCTSCSVWLGIDNDPTAGVNLLFGNITGYLPNPESLNLEMASVQAQTGYNFDPFSASSTAFRLEIRDATNAVIAGSDIVVNVPEPGSIALAGLGLLGAAAFTRRRKA
jgi:hypothetical protein